MQLDRLPAEEYPRRRRRRRRRGAEGCRTLHTVKGTRELSQQNLVSLSCVLTLIVSAIHGALNSVDHKTMSGVSPALIGAPTARSTTAQPASKRSVQCRLFSRGTECYLWFVSGAIQGFSLSAVQTETDGSTIDNIGLNQ